MSNIKSQDLTLMYLKNLYRLLTESQLKTLM